MNLKAMLEGVTKRLPDKIAIVSGEKRISYRELESASNRFARALIGMGITHGEPVVLLAENSPEYVVAYFGIVKMGGVAVPLDSKYKIPELASLFNDCQPKVIVGEEGTLKSVTPKLSEFPSIEAAIDLSSRLKGNCMTYREIMATEPGERLDFEPSPDALANINYTSGPTFSPRGVLLTHEHLVKSAAVYNEFLKQTEKDVFVQFALPMHHVVGLGAIILTAVSGGSSVTIVPGLSVDNLLETIAREKGSIFMGVPFVYTLMVEHARAKGIKQNLSSLRLCIVGAAPTPVELMTDFTKLFGKKVVQFYGLTEANAFVTCQSADEEGTPGSVGRPLAGWTLGITDVSGKALPRGQEGEILISGLITRGYHNKPDATARTVKDGWLKTEDLGRLNEKGELFITGRIKNMIKVKGQNIYPSDIEKVLSLHPAVYHVTVVGAPEELRGEIVKAYVQLKDGMNATEEELRHFCLPYVANYKIPRQVVFVTDWSALTRHPLI